MDENIVMEYTPGESCFYLRFPYNRRNEAKKIGGTWSAAQRAWKFAVDLRIWEAIKKKFGGNGNLIAKKSFLTELERVKKQQEDFYRLREQAVEDNPIEYSVDGISLNGKNPLFNYQKWGIKCGLQVGDGFLIGDQPGLGKSIQALGIALQRKKEGLIRNCLIVCLASLKYNWVAEIEKFTKEKCLVIDGTSEERKKKWVAEGYFFKIVNYEIIVKDLFIDINSDSNKPLSREEKEYRKYMQKRFDMIVVDEIHAIKTHKSQRSKALKQFTAKYRLGLSGTPVDGKLEELHSIFQFLNDK